MQRLRYKKCRKGIKDMETITKNRRNSKLSQKTIILIFQATLSALCIVKTPSQPIMCRSRTTVCHVSHKRSGVSIIHPEKSE